MNNRQAKRIKNNLSYFSYASDTMVRIEKPVVKLFTVRRRKDDELMARGLTETDAQLMIDKAKAGKKAALYIAML
jgi:hypothetical protein